MKALSKKILISSIIFSMFAMLLCFGIFFQPQQKVYAYTSGSCTTLAPSIYGDEATGIFGGWGLRIEDGGNFKNTDNVWNIKITNRISSLPSNDGTNPTGYAYYFDVTGSPNSTLNQKENTSNLTCYVYDIEENNVVTHQDIYIYANVETIYAPANCKFLFSSGEDPYLAWANKQNYQSILRSVVLENFDTSYVTTMDSMFWGESGCPYFTSIIGLENFNTSNVTNMHWMFMRCSELTLINVKSFDTSNVTNMASMFCQCSSVTSLDLSSFNTSNVTTMSSMFRESNHLEEIDWDINTVNLKNIDGMFSGCSSLTSLDMSSWNLSSVESCSHAFDGCTSLTTIYTPQALSESAAAIELPSTFEGSDGDQGNTTLGYFPLSTDGIKQVIYDSGYEGQRTYEQPRTAETGVFVDVILPVVFVLIVGTLSVMYIGQGKKKKHII